MQMTEAEGVDGDRATLKSCCGSAQVLLPASFLRGRITPALFLDDSGSAEKDGFQRSFGRRVSGELPVAQGTRVWGHLQVDAHKEIGGRQDRDQGSWTHRIDGRGSATFALTCCIVRCCFIYLVCTYSESMLYIEV